jgi:preprotein translocase subunit SecG
VFGARGASNFLSKSTKWLAIVFFGISLGMAWYATHTATQGPAQQDLGLMGQVPGAATPAPPTPGATVPATPAAQPAQVPASTVPAAPAATQPGSQPQPAPPPSGG